MSRIKQGLSEFKEQADIVKKEYGGNKLRWYSDMLWSLIRYGARPIDYVRFEFHKKSGKERNKYLTIFKYFNLAKKIRRNLNNNISGDKVNEYKIYSKFISRPWLLIDKDTNKDEVINFLRKNEKVIAKPVNGEQGKNIFVINYSDSNSIEKVLNICKNNNYILEGVIQNCDEIRSLNPSSLNTFRCYTFIDKKGNVNILEIMLRVGSKGSNVDNWGSGGVGYVFDLATGICIQPGLDKKNNPYLNHPGTDKLMIGFSIPRYKELIKYVNDLCMVEPSARFVGWDIAITPTGFELIEMNCPGGHDFLQVFGRPWGDYLKNNW